MLRQAKDFQISKVHITGWGGRGEITQCLDQNLKELYWPELNTPHHKYHASVKQSWETCIFWNIVHEWLPFLLISALGKEEYMKHIQIIKKEKGGVWLDQLPRKLLTSQLTAIEPSYLVLNKDNNKKNSRKILTKSRLTWQKVLPKSQKILLKSAGLLYLEEQNKQNYLQCQHERIIIW